MDRERFDALARLVAARGSRRAALGAILSLALLERGSRVGAEPGKAKGKGHSKGTGKGHDTGNGQGHPSDKACAALACETYPVPAGEKAEFCCKGGFCSCGGKCCENACFQTGAERSPTSVFCCTGPKLVICTVKVGGIETEACCEGSCDACDAGTTGIAGSYRRR